MTKPFTYSLRTRLAIPRTYLVLFLMAALLVIPAVALEPEEQAVFVRIVDTGPGLCCIIQIPTETGDLRHVIFDAGDFRSNAKKSTIEAINELIEPGSEIDFLFLSHNDADHIGSVDLICQDYQVKRIFHSEIERNETATLKRALKAIKDEQDEGALVTNLKHVEVAPGSTYKIGDGWLTILAGVNEPPESWGLSRGSSDWLNAGSIVVRLFYRGRSILFCGDAVGRRDDESDEDIIATEAQIVDFGEVLPVRSDLVVAPHHGGNDASSLPFIRMISPDWVVFSAGHDHHHPRAQAANRYIKAGVRPEHILRTDRGDNEGGPEWGDGASSPTDPRDPIADDSVDILIRANGQMVVEYQNP